MFFSGGQAPTLYGIHTVQSLDVVQAADDGGCPRPLGAEEPQHGRAAGSIQGGERRAEGAMEQREEERARGVDTLDKAEHFIVDGVSARFRMCFSSIEA